MQQKIFTTMSEQQQLLQNETSGEMVLLSDQMIFALLGQVDDFLTWVPPAAAQRGCMVGIYPDPSWECGSGGGSSRQKPKWAQPVRASHQHFSLHKNQKGGKKGDFLLVSCISARLWLVVGLTVLNGRLCA